MMLSCGSVAEATAQASADWDARVAQLAEAAPGEVVVTAMGDAIWSRPISGMSDERMRSVFDVARAADVAFLNLEVPLVDRGAPSPGKSALTRGPTSLVQELAWAGIDVVSIANNHAMDYGVRGLESSIGALQGAGIRHSGAGRDITEAMTPAVLHVRDRRIAFLSFVAAPRIAPPQGAPAGPRLAGVAPIRGATVRLPSGEVLTSPWAQDIARMEQAIAMAQSEADFVAVSVHFHWRQPEVIDPAGEQLIARAAIEAGADVVVGHGPTVLGGIEIYEGKPILYSVGKIVHHVSPEAYHLFPETQRFVEGMLADERYPESVVVRWIIGTDGHLRRLELLPVEISPDGNPYFANGEMSGRVLDRLESLSKPFGTSLVREYWYAVVNLTGSS